MRRLLPLLLLTACSAQPHAGSAVAGPGAGGVCEVSLEVRNESVRPLPELRSGLIGEIMRLKEGKDPASFSAVDAFEDAALAELGRKGVVARTDPHPGVAVLRIAIRDLEIRDAAAAGAVAFVSASYVLLDASGETQWEAVEKRLPVQLGGPDLTRSVLARIGLEAVAHALSSFPASTSP